MRSGRRLTTVAQVSSTVAGRLMTTWVSGSPMSVQMFWSNSSGAYTLPMHSDSMVTPSSVSVVTTADIPVALPAGMVMPRVSERRSSR